MAAHYWAVVALVGWPSPLAPARRVGGPLAAPPPADVIISPGDVDHDHGRGRARPVASRHRHR